MLQKISNLEQVTVTGAAGFIGSQLSLGLLEAGLAPEKLHCVDKSQAWQERSCTKQLRENESISFQDMEAYLEDCNRSKAKSQLIFHMGASSSTEETREDFLERVNVDYSKTLWNFATDKQIPFIYASSAATYGDGSLGFSDSPKLYSQLKPLNPYGRSKLRFDQWVDEQEVGPSRWAGFRFFNVYGPGEAHKGSQWSVLWKAHREFKEKGYVKLFKSHHPDFSDGEQKRDFVWVGDLVDVMLSFALNEHNSGIYNLGTGEARSFKDLVAAVAKSMGVENKIEYIPTPEHLREHYQYFTQADLSRLRAAGYTKPMTRLEEGIALSLRSMKP